MTKVYHVRKARKSYPNQGIKKGMPYWWYSTKRNGRFTGKIKFAKKPRPSQLTGSAYLAAVLGAHEAVDDAVDALNAAIGTANVGANGDDDASDDSGTAAGIEAARNALADVLKNEAATVKEAGQECLSSRENMPERLQEGEVGQLLERRVVACSGLAAVLSVIADAVRCRSVEDVAADGVDDFMDQVDWTEAEE